MRVVFALLVVLLSSLALAGQAFAQSHPQSVFPQPVDPWHSWGATRPAAPQQSQPQGVFPQPVDPWRSWGVMGQAPQGFMPQTPAPAVVPGDWFWDGSQWVWMPAPWQ